MEENEDDIFTLETGLVDEEVYLIGSIISQWGILENEIFEQTALSFNDDEPFHRTMKSPQFSKVLSLWSERVVVHKDRERRKKLERIREDIEGMNEFRQAIVHSRWEWRPECITAVRFHKKQIKRVSFTADDLKDFSRKLARIRFWIRYPGGIEDLAEERDKVGGGAISRYGYEMMFKTNSSDE